jgi:predicted nucleotidyltransferase
MLNAAIPLHIPKLGSNIPEMGRDKPASSVKRPASLADALFSRTQQAVLGLLFGQPDRSFYATELIKRLEAGSGAVQRELARLEESGLVSVSRVGTQKHYQANAGSPLYAELCSLVQKTVGIAEPLRVALKKIAPRIIAAFVFGSMAKRRDTASSDIDLMLVSDSLTYADVFAAVEPQVAKLGRPINPTVYSRKEWIKRLNEENAFAVRVKHQPKIWLYGSEDDLRA